jgi:prepilin-type N-terminal cleavage/methylation domain-containing protein
MILQGRNVKFGHCTGVAGYSMTELMVVMVVVGVLTATGLPMVLSSWRASSARAGAEEMVTVLNEARQLAIKENVDVCVTNDGARVQFHLTACGNPAWTGAGTDANGFIRLSKNVTVSSANTLVFRYLGTANDTTYVVTANGRTMNVTVATSGRVRIGS